VRCSRHCVLCAAVRRETTTADDRRRQLAMTAWTKYTRMSQNRSRAPCRTHAHSHRPLRRHPADETLRVSHDNNHLMITRIHTSIPGLYSSVLAQIDCHLANKTLCTLHRQQGNSVSLKTQCHRPHVLHNKAMVHRMQVRCATSAGKKCWALHQQNHIMYTHVHTSILVLYRTMWPRSCSPEPCWQHAVSNRSYRRHRVHKTLYSSLTTKQQCLTDFTPAPLHD